MRVFGLYHRTLYYQPHKFPNPTIEKQRDSHSYVLPTVELRQQLYIGTYILRNRRSLIPFAQFGNFRESAGIDVITPAESLTQQLPFRRSRLIIAVIRRLSHHLSLIRIDPFSPAGLILLGSKVVDTCAQRDFRIIYCHIYQEMAHSYILSLYTCTTYYILQSLSAPFVARPAHARVYTTVLHLRNTAVAAAAAAKENFADRKLC